MSSARYQHKTCGMNSRLVAALRTAVADGDEAALAQRLAARFTGRSAAVIIAPPVGKARAVASNALGGVASKKPFLVVWLLLDPTDIDSKQTTFLHVGASEAWHMGALYKLDDSDEPIDLERKPACSSTLTAIDEVARGATTKEAANDAAFRMLEDAVGFTMLDNAEAFQRHPDPSGGRWVIVRTRISKHDDDGGGREGFEMSGTRYSVYDTGDSVTTPVRVVEFRAYLSCGGSSGAEDGKCCWVSNGEDATLDLERGQEVVGLLDPPVASLAGGAEDA